MQQPQPNNNFISQPSFNTNYMQQPMPNPEDITDPTTAMNMALVLMAKAFKLNYSTPINNNQRISFKLNYSTPINNTNQHSRNGLIVVLGIANQNLNPNGNGNVVAARAEGNVIENNGDLEEIEEVNENCIMMANLQQASTSGTHTDKALVYDSDGLAEEEQYTKLLEPIPKPHQVQQNDSNVIFVVSNVEQSGGTVKQHPATVEETHAYFESLYNNLAIEVEKVNSVKCKMKETNADLTTELARYKNQEKCFEISQEKYDKLERCYQKSVYQEQCLTKKINALHLSSAKMITTLNEEIVNLNNQLSKEKSTVSFLNEEKKKLKSNFKIHEDELLDKQIQLENKIKELDNIFVKTGQSIQTMHQAQQIQQSLYNGKVLLEKHDPPAVYDSEETLQLAQEKASKFVRDFKSLAKEADESLAKHKALEFEIERVLRAVVNQDIMSIVQSSSGVDTSNLQTELEHTKERFENCIIKKENEYAKLWNDWYKKSRECRYDKISYDKAYNDMQQKIKRLQAQLGDQKGKSKDTPCISDTLDPLSQKLENENVKLEFQVLNYSKENALLKTTYKNLFDSITVSKQKDTTHGTSANNKFSRQSILRKPTSSSGPKLYSVTPLPKSKVIPKVGESNALLKLVTSNSAPSFQELTVVNNERVIDPGIFRINPFKASRLEKIEVNRRSLQSSNYPDHTSSECNNIKLAIRNEKSEKNQRANVSKSTNQKKHKANVKKSKKLGFEDKLASSRPRKLRTYLKCNTESEFDTFVFDTASDSNPREPTKKGFPSSTSSLDRNGLESTSNSSAVVMRTSKYDESNASALDDPTLRVGNPVIEVLLKLNLPDHRFTTSCSIDKDKYMMKAKVHVSKSSAISDVQALPQKNIIDTITEVDRAEKEQEPERPTRAVPISTVRRITSPNPELEMIRSSSRIQLTDTTLAFSVPQQTAPDAKLKVLNKEHSQKVKKAMELRKKRLEQYMWTTSSRLKPKPITDVKIHPNTKSAVLTVYRGNDQRNFDVHKPFKFVDFRVTEMDE
ncbi:hypothetical protein Tco_0489578 [Tanacetum coccineum]